MRPSGACRAWRQSAGRRGRRGGAGEGAQALQAYEQALQREALQHPEALALALVFERELKQLYVAVTRARMELVIHEVDLEGGGGGSSAAGAPALLLLQKLSLLRI